MPRLRSKERQLLELVSNAVFHNPFSEARQRTDAALAGVDVAALMADSNALELRLARVEALLEAWGGASLDLATFSETDRPLVERALLFVLFHRSWDDFAGLEAAGHQKQRPVRAPFVKPLIARLQGHGLPRSRARRYVELFWQIWRAWLFIDRGLTGRSPSMIKLRERLWNNVFTHDLEQYDRWLALRMEDFSTILLGETGTGKGAAAAAIGRSVFIPLHPSDEHFVADPSDTFLSVNLAEYARGVIESELFGHRKGAFTGAVEAHEGLLARCSAHGSIFLDELGELDLPLQTKLLRVLQDREFSPVGSHEKRRFAGRVIAATNRDLDRMRVEGGFRDDFYYRLCGDVIVLPTLRERIAESPDELPRLVEAILGRWLGPERDANGGPVSAPSDVLDAVLGALHRDLPGEGRAYAWPGNVRELEQAIRRILLTGRYEPSAPPASDDAEVRLRRALEGGELTATQLVADYCRLLYARHGTYEQVGRIAGLDRRTVKKYVTNGEA